MKILVTGGAGYIGSIVAGHLGTIIADAWAWFQAHPSGYQPDGLHP